MGRTQLRNTGALTAVAVKALVVAGLAVQAASVADVPGTGTAWMWMRRFQETHQGSDGKIGMGENSSWVIVCFGLLCVFVERVDMCVRRAYTEKFAIVHILECE